MGNEPLADLARWLKLPAHGAREAESAEAEVAAVERRYGVRLPTDLRSHLLRLGPRESAVWDDELILWWPASRLRNMPDEYPQGSENPVVAREANRYIFFADYSIWCWAWAICCGDGAQRGKVAVIGASGDAFIADSFADFVTRYLRDPMSIMP